MKTVVASKSDIKKMGLKQCDLISIESLGDYGFDTDLVDNMLEYDIWPDMIKIGDKYFVVRSHIFGVVNRLLNNELAIYKAVSAKEKLIADSQKYLDDNKVKLEPEDFERIQAGEIDLISLIEEKNANKTFEVVEVIE